MYYPYLRGRQFELLALRNFSESFIGEAKVFPIIEPVRINRNSLKRAATTMTEKGIRYGIILNPEYGDCAGNFIDLSIEENFPDTNQWSPAFIIGKQSISQIASTIHDNGYQNVILILPKAVSVNEDDFAELITDSAIAKVITDPSRRKVARATRNKGKDLIELDDKFIAQPTNQAYTSIDEELFSEEFFYFREDNFAGFSDYTILPNEFREGGTLPKVVVIHLTYRKTEDQIFIKHFCSDTNQEDRSNIQGKFSEAAYKAITFFDSMGYNSPALDNLRENLVNGTFPGLGVLKKISILHHLDLVQKILSA